MSRLRPVRQEGFGLLVFVLMASVVALSIVLGYSGLLTREEANRRPAKMQALLEQYKTQVMGLYQQHATELDNPSAGNGVTFGDIFAGANIPVRHGLSGAMSNLLPGESGLLYRRIVLFYPSETDETNPPDLASFAATGEFKSCTDESLPCSPRQFITMDSRDIHRAALLETQRRLERVALKAQAFFKARMLQDAEKNISVNYFRTPFGPSGPGVAGNPCLTDESIDLANPSLRAINELQCLDTYRPLVSLVGSTWVPQTNLPLVLGLASDELVSGWGAPIEASSWQDSETSEPPFTMVFRAPNPFGGYVTMRAIQQI
ncbi:MULTISPECIES: hypothetical protein [unclassified Variovorax]|uniref:hypothetical protein n=1 Tax=unclassified Variovorax TaxID=663243 RepID=UPI00076C14D7|nr:MULTISPECIES: hypothetical protein [unclassified Variovorax]KWT98306.1 hypothetical protein APY03_0441 [Variovorax sp. WDL1]PNG50039.1 hypothetical protein CHC06_05620 [Variovorax sp. B2]PNG50911.1 hypothetical protein CHC07_05525 [Variovorax sp. B4]VTU41559.1 hypothetical protein SRS16P1_00033 [Variovorax sp. SRS16]VTU41582.1 hypothetical protein E5P1_00033 [Variovorax sp. PBL-E5]